MKVHRQIVAGTAGHIDHGKSALVRALTGIDPDRLKEEKERGITIDLGFANLTLDDGTQVGFVDVPGHERFVKNMLAGVGGIDVVLLIIAADESIKPQTREHFDICRLLRLRHGIIVLTKTDLAERDLLDLARLEAREFVAGSFLEAAPIVAVSSRTGEGLDDLRQALRTISAQVEARPPSGLVRLPIDRAFSVKGFGTVVTGTLIAGTLSEGDQVAILPQGIEGRVRGLQVFGRTTSVARPGQRTAVNLKEIEGSDVGRGAVVSVPGVLEPTYLLDVDLELLAGAGAPLKDLTRVRFHHGTAEVLARVKLAAPAPIPPGGRGFAQLRLESPVVALPGDRAILRRYSPPLTIGGATILHNRPPKLRSALPGGAARFTRLADPSPAVWLQVTIEEAGAAGLDLAGLRSRSGLDAERLQAILEGPVRAGQIARLDATPARYLSGQVRDDLRAAVVAALEAYHRKEPLKEGLPREELRMRIFAHSHPDVFRSILAELDAEGIVRAEKDRVARAGHAVALAPAEAALMEQIEARFKAGGANPPELPEIVAALRADATRAAKLQHLLLSRGRLVRIQDGKVFHAEAIEDLKKRLWAQRSRNPVIDIPEFKELSGTTRKNAIPLLEHFDQVRVTRREGNRRIILPPPQGAPN